MLDGNQIHGLGRRGQRPPDDDFTQGHRTDSYRADNVIDRPFRSDNPHTFGLTSGQRLYQFRRIQIVQTVISGAIVTYEPLLHLRMADKKAAAQHPAKSINDGDRMLDPLRDSMGNLGIAPAA